MKKKQWRIEMKDRLAKLHPQEKQAYLTEIYARLFSQHIWKNSETIAVTISVKKELNTEPIIRKAWSEGKKVVVPKCIPAEKKLDFYYLNDFNQLENRFYGLMEPNPNECTSAKKQELDLILVPGLVFDRFGYRIGQGGGYYDRFLEKSSFATCSICYDFQLIADELPRQRYDVSIDTIITPTEVINN